MHMTDTRQSRLCSGHALTCFTGQAPVGVRVGVARVARITCDGAGVRCSVRVEVAYIAFFFIREGDKGTERQRNRVKDMASKDRRVCGCLNGIRGVVIARYVYSGRFLTQEE